MYITLYFDTRRGLALVDDYHILAFLRPVDCKTYYCPMSPRLYKWDECARNIGLVYLIFYQTLQRILYNFRSKIPIKSFELPTDINQLDVLGEMGVRASLR